MSAPPRITAGDQAYRVQHGLDRWPLARAAEFTEHPLGVVGADRLVVDQVEHGPGVHLHEVLLGGGT
jgi:hypothetical protein